MSVNSVLVYTRINYFIENVDNKLEEKIKQILDDAVNSQANQYAGLSHKGASFMMPLRRLYSTSSYFLPWSLIIIFSMYIITICIYRIIYKNVTFI